MSLPSSKIPKRMYIVLPGNTLSIIYYYLIVSHLDKEIKENYKDNESIREQRCLQIGPLLNDMKSELESLRDALDPAKEPELLKAVNVSVHFSPRSSS